MKPLFFLPATINFELEPTVKCWWAMTRTSLSLIWEPDGTSAMFFTAFKNPPKSFGMLSGLTLGLTFEK